MESLLPVFDSSYFGLVAGGLTDVIIIIGVGKSTCCDEFNIEPESAELVDGLCSCLKFGISGAASESRRFLLCVATTFKFNYSTREK